LNSLKASKSKLAPQARSADTSTNNQDKLLYGGDWHCWRKQTCLQRTAEPGKQRASRQAIAEAVLAPVHEDLVHIFEL
jgi:hypothetical protein